MSTIIYDMYHVKGGSTRHMIWSLSLHVITQDDNFTKLKCFLKHDNLIGKPT
jgi:hypothetical protein